LTTEIAALRARVAAMSLDALALRKSNADLTARERVTSARLAIAEKYRLAGVAAAARLGSRMKTRVVKSVARQLATLPGESPPGSRRHRCCGQHCSRIADPCDGMRDMAH
jgi:hypothetical protein